MWALSPSLRRRNQLTNPDREFHIGERLALREWATQKWPNHLGFGEYEWISCIHMNKGVQYVYRYVYRILMDFIGIHRYARDVQKYPLLKLIETGIKSPLLGSGILQFLIWYQLNGVSVFVFAMKPADYSFEGDHHLIQSISCHFKADRTIWVRVAPIRNVRQSV